MEHILYHARSARFELLGDVFLTQLKSIPNRHQEGCATVHQLLENPVLRPVHLMLIKICGLSHIWRNTVKQRSQERWIS